MKFQEIRDALIVSELKSSSEALSKIKDNNIAIEVDPVKCEEIIEDYERLSRVSKVPTQAIEAKEFVLNLKQNIGSSGKFLQFEAGSNGLDFMLFITESGTIIGCIRTGVIANNA